MWDGLRKTFAAIQLTGWRFMLPVIAGYEADLQRRTDEELRKLSLSIRYEIRSGVSAQAVLPKAFALVREAGRRALNMRHFDVQLLGGIAMHHGNIAEMQTGEGKTLTATLVMYLAALAGKGAHLATANDYLARRDAELMRPLYEMLGLTVGVVEAETQRPERFAAYRCDLTYGTAKEFGFDFLRDRLLARATGGFQNQKLATMLGQTTAVDSSEPVQRELHFALVDEADSILIDEARTPLIVSSIPGGKEAWRLALYRWAADSADSFCECKHYTADHDRRQVELTAAGRQHLRELPRPRGLQQAGMLDLYEHIERAIKVNREYFRDRHYVVRDAEIVIIDEFTGRPSEGRRWKAGIHQAIEARESLEISPDAGDAARITLQDFFKRYDQVCGMTGTALSSRSELKQIYNIGVVAVPTNRPPQRTQLPTQVFGREADKWGAIVEEVKQLQASGRPVLIGTRSIDKSERLSRLLTAEAIDHDVLNAKEIAREADIVAQAGRANRVTVATNMAGRGTDIKLEPEVEAAGGLHVICSEMHESARIDRQLIGRCGRQGDAGSYRIFVSLEDDLLTTAFGQAWGESYRKQGSRGGRFDSLAGLFAKAQRRIEAQQFQQRTLMMHNEAQRHDMQQQMGQDPYLDAPA